MIVVPGPASEELGIKIGAALNVDLVAVQGKIFPDGESYIRFKGSLRNKDIVIVQTTAPPQDTNIIQLLLLIDTARDLDAKSVTAVVPYLAYARQDKRFRAGEALSMRTIIRLLEAVGTNRLITVNAHNPKALELFKGQTDDLSAIPMLAQYFKEKGLDGAFSLGPDEGASDVVKEANSVLKGGYGWLKKRRDIITGEIAFEKTTLDVRGRDVIVFDDIISTGSTMVSAVKILKDQGARRIYAACVHPLLTDGAKERILCNGADEIVSTDCINSPTSVVSVAPLIAKALRREL